MVHSLLKSLFLYSTLAASVVLAAPAQRHQHRDRRGVAAGSVSRREDLLLSYPWVGGSTASTHVKKRSKGMKKAIAKKRVTNAMRIANGLPPLPPRKLYDGSKSGSAHRARASPSFASAILVYDSNGLSGNLLGYVSKDFNAWGDYAFTTDCTAAMLSPIFLSGALTNPASPSDYLNVGFASFVGDSAFSTGSFNFALMGGTASTDTGSPPVSSYQHSDDMSYTYDIESNVWSLTANKELIPTWVNPGGNPAPTEIGYTPQWDNSIVISGSLGAFSANWANTVLIRLFLTDQFTCGN